MGTLIELYNKIREKVSQRERTVPVVCHECSTLRPIKYNNIENIERSPCCGSPIAPPPKGTKLGQKWDEHNGTRVHQSSEVDAEEVIESIDTSRMNK